MLYFRSPIYMIFYALIFISTVYSLSTLEIEQIDTQFVNYLYDKQLYDNNPLDIFADENDLIPSTEDDNVIQLYKTKLKLSLFTPLNTPTERPFVRRHLTADHSYADFLRTRFSLSDNPDGNPRLSYWHIISDISKSLSIRAGTYRHNRAMGLVLGGAQKEPYAKQSTISFFNSFTNTIGSNSNGLYINYHTKYLKNELSYAWNENLLRSAVTRKISNGELSFLSTINPLLSIREYAFSVYANKTTAKTYKTETEVALSPNGVAFAAKQQAFNNAGKISLTIWEIGDSFSISTTKGPTLHYGWHYISNDSTHYARPGEMGCIINMSVHKNNLGAEVYGGTAYLKNYNRTRSLFKSKVTYDHRPFSIAFLERIRIDKAEYGNFSYSTHALQLEHQLTERWTATTVNSFYKTSGKPLSYESTLSMSFTTKCFLIKAGPELLYKQNRFLYGIHISEALYDTNGGKISFSLSGTSTINMRVNTEWYL